MYALQCIIINTRSVKESRLVEFSQTEPQRIAFTNRINDKCIIDDRQNDYISNECTVVSIVRAQVLDILIGRIDIFDTFPFIWRLTCTNRDSITIEVSLKNMQGEEVNRITTEGCSKRIRITFRLPTAQVYCVVGNRIASLNMRPYVRSVGNRDMGCMLFEIFREYIKP